MKWQFVGWHAAQPEGTAAGRQLYAVGEALRALGHEVEAWSWRPTQPVGATATWCEWRPLPDEPTWRTRGRALLRPRSDIVRAGWRGEPGAVVVADDPASWAAVADHVGTRITTIHYSVALDRRALHDRHPARLQDRRGERAAVGGSDQSWALSERVARQVGCDVVVPATVPMPASPLEPVADPVVGMLADWSWPPNRRAARLLFDAWPVVRRTVSGARLLLAGRGELSLGAAAGVEVIGAVPAAADLLSRIAVFAFPCPPTSGPKMKVLDALAHGVPVVTTTAGVEGITDIGSGAEVADESAFADALVRLLLDPQRRAEMGRAARQAILSAHAPAVAAQARADAVATARAASG